MTFVESDRKNLQLEEHRRLAIGNLNQILIGEEESTLRDHQLSIINSLHASFKSGETAGYITAPPGSGKTAVMAIVAESLGLKTLVLSPTQQILDQFSKEAKIFTPNLKVSSYDGRSKDTSGNVINATYQSLSVLLGKERGGKPHIKKGKGTTINPEEVGLLLCDEGDLAFGEKTHQYYRQFPNALMLAFTATPYFGNISGLKDRGIVQEDERWVGMTKNLIHEMTLEEGMERGILSPLDVHFISTDIQVPDIKILSGDYSPSDLRRFFEISSRDALILGMICGTDAIPSGINLSTEQLKEIKTIHEKIAGKRTVVYSISQSHADSLAEQISGKGIGSASVHGNVDPDQRSSVLRSHARGETQVITGVDMIRRGWNSPETEVMIFARPTYSGVKKVQELGRGLRISPESGKERAVGIEMVDNMNRRTQSPVFISDVFDPEYILKGSQTGREVRSGTTSTGRSLPVVSFSGMRIDTIFKEATSLEMLKNRFKQADVSQIVKTMELMIAEAKSAEPEANLYRIIKLVEEQLPKHIPGEAFEVAFQSLASLDTNTKDLGRRAVMYLSFGTLMTVIEPYIKYCKTSDEQDELLHVALDGAYKNIDKLSTKIPTRQQLYRHAKDNVSSYVLERYGIDPLDLEENFSKIKTEVASILGISGLSSSDVDSVVDELANIYGVEKDKIKSYIRSQIDYKLVPDEKMDENADVFEAVLPGLLKVELIESLSRLSEGERKILELNFGLFGMPEYTNKQIGSLFEIGGSAVGNRKVIAIRKLRLDGRNLKIYHEGPDISSEERWSYPIYTRWGEHTFNLDEYVKEKNRKEAEEANINNPFYIGKFVSSAHATNVLRERGFNYIADLFINSPDRVREKWFKSGPYSRFVFSFNILKEILYYKLRQEYINAAYDKVPADDPELVNQIALATVYQLRRGIGIYVTLDEFQRIYRDSIEGIDVENLTPDMDKVLEQRLFVVGFRRLRKLVDNKS